MIWEAFLGGLIAGWLLEFAIDYVFWRPRRICSEAEEELQEAVVLLRREVSRLRRQQDGDGEEQEDDEEEKEPDDLQKIWGIGPKVEAVLCLRGITTFSQLAATDPETLEDLLENAGERFRLSRYNVIESWHKQAQLAGAGRWLELDAYQAEVARTRRRLRRNRGR